MARGRLVQRDGDDLGELDVADLARGRVPAGHRLQAVEQVDEPGSESDFVSVEDTPRTDLANHPWSLQGGGATSLQARIEDARPTLKRSSSSIGITAFTLEDDLFTQPLGVIGRHGVPSEQIRPLMQGDVIRDWRAAPDTEVVFPYSEAIEPAGLDDRTFRMMWRGARRSARTRCSVA